MSVPMNAHDWQMLGARPVEDVSEALLLQVT